MSLHAWWPTAAQEISGQLTSPLAILLRQLSRGRQPPSPRLHLAVLVEPFLSYVLDGSKTVESRFSMVRGAPFRSAEHGDVVLLKAAAGPVVGACGIVRTWYFSQPSAGQIAAIRKRFGDAIRDDVPGFWSKRANAQYVSLFELGDVQRLEAPLSCPKRDRRGWVVLNRSNPQAQLRLP